MTQDPDPQSVDKLSACLHFLLHPALSAGEKRLLADAIRFPQEALLAQPPISLSATVGQPRGSEPGELAFHPSPLSEPQSKRWEQWRSPLGRIRTAADFIGSWLQATPTAGARRHWVCYWDTDYPPLLRNLARPPWLLLLEGELPDVNAPTLAMVGSRNATRAGLRRAREFASELSAGGWVIVSGMAKGIDAQAHAGALDANGPTIAVLGCGIDVTYPPENASLRSAILSAGGLLMSEYPPGTPPNERFFPARNRIIAGLSQGVLVVEAAVRSGSLITAHQANELGRSVMAIPGSIDTPQARGCHQMIREGARLVETLSDILEELQGVTAKTPATPPANRRKRNRTTPTLWNEPAQASDLDPSLRKLLSALNGQPMQFDDISITCNFPAQQLSAALTQLEMAGLLEARPGQWWAPV